MGIVDALGMDAIPGKIGVKRERVSSVIIENAGGACIGNVRVVTKILKMNGFWILELVSVHIRKAHWIESMGTGVRPGFTDTIC